MGRSASLDLPLPRQLLTADLGTLFTLDALPDTHPILARLSEQSIRLCLVSDARSFSVVDAPPQWRAHDLMVAVVTRAAQSITFCRTDRVTNSLVFEVHRTGRPSGGARHLSDTPLGTFVGLQEGELLDADGDPIRSSDLEKGVRFELCVWTDNGATVSGLIKSFPQLTESADAHLRTTGEPDNANLTFAAGVEVDRQISVRVRARHPELVLELAEPLPAGYPRPRVEYDNAADFAGGFVVRGSDGR